MHLRAPVGQLQSKLKQQDEMAAVDMSLRHVRVPSAGPVTVATLLPPVMQIAWLLQPFMASGTTLVAPPGTTSVAPPEPPYGLSKPPNGGFSSDGIDWNAIMEAQRALRVKCECVRANNALIHQLTVMPSVQLVLMNPQDVSRTVSKSEAEGATLSGLPEIGFELGPLRNPLSSPGLDSYMNFRESGK